MRRTMTPAEEAKWEMAMRSPPPASKDPGTVTRRRAYTMDVLEELWTEWTSQNPNHRDGFEFLMRVRKR